MLLETLAVRPPDKGNRSRIYAPSDFFPPLERGAPIRQGLDHDVVVVVEHFLHFVGVAVAQFADDAERDRGHGCQDEGLELGFVLAVDGGVLEDAVDQAAAPVGHCRAADVAGGFCGSAALMAVHSRNSRRLRSSTASRAIATMPGIALRPAFQCMMAKRETCSSRAADEV